MMLIRTYRVRGHLAAKLDPLGLTQRELPADLTPGYHGFTDADLDRKIWLGGTLGFQEASIRQILPVLQANYCGTVGLEYMHINDLEERRFLQDRMEGKDAAITFTPEGKQSILGQGDPTASSGKNSSPRNMSAPSASASTAARARSRRLKRSSNMAAQMGVDARSPSAWPIAAG